MTCMTIKIFFCKFYMSLRRENEVIDILCYLGLVIYKNYYQNKNLQRKKIKKSSWRFRKNCGLREGEQYFPQKLENLNKFWKEFFEKRGRDLYGHGRGPNNQNVKECHRKVDPVKHLNFKFDRKILLKFLNQMMRIIIF